MLVSYSDVFGITLDRGVAENIRRGDLVRMGQNLFPHFEVVAVDADKAWVRNISDGTDHLAMLSRCRKVVDELQQAA